MNLPIIINVLRRTTQTLEKVVDRLVIIWTSLKSNKNSLNPGVHKETSPNEKKIILSKSSSAYLLPNKKYIQRFSWQNLTKLNRILDPWQLQINLHRVHPRNIDERLWKGLKRHLTSYQFHFHEIFPGRVVDNHAYVNSRRIF